MHSKSFTQSSFVAGDRVLCRGFSPQNWAATFIEYGPANVACPANHVSYPGMRIAYVQSDRFGRMPIWERELVAA